jgi:hypothetical protein
MNLACRIERARHDFCARHLCGCNIHVLPNGQRLGQASLKKLLQTRSPPPKAY